jgi:hypothetical protein
MFHSWLSPIFVFKVKLSLIFHAQKLTLAIENQSHTAARRCPVTPTVCGLALTEFNGGTSLYPNNALLNAQQQLIAYRSDKRMQ